MNENQLQSTEGPRLFVLAIAMGLSIIVLLGIIVFWDYKEKTAVEEALGFAENLRCTRKSIPPPPMYGMPEELLFECNGVIINRRIVLLLKEMSEIKKGEYKEYDEIFWEIVVNSFRVK